MRRSVRECDVECPRSIGGNFPRRCGGREQGKGRIVGAVDDVDSQDPEGEVGVSI